MRRLLRWTVNTSAVASLLLCLATAGLWVRSYRVYDHFDASRTSRAYGPDYDVRLYMCFATSEDGRFAGFFSRADIKHYHSTPHGEFKLSHDATAYARFYSFEASHHASRDLVTNGWSWRLPAWSLVSALALLPAVVVLRQIRAVRRRRRRSQLGCCPACGYDLRATPGRCPECGTAAGGAGERG